MNKTIGNYVFKGCFDDMNLFTTNLKEQKLPNKIKKKPKK